MRDPGVLRVLAHPARMRIYAAMAREPLSAKELAARLEQPISRVSYHVRTLADAGLLRAVRQTQRRGAVETHYRAIATLDIGDDAAGQAGTGGAGVLVEALVREVAEDTLEAVRRGASADPEFVLSRAHFRVTPQGRARLHAEVLALRDRLLALEAELREEAERAEGEATEMNVTLGLYEGALRAERNGAFLMASAPEGEDVRTPARVPPPEAPLR
jgi:DNA-binding transcriptional ArsR family regulator